MGTVVVLVVAGLAAAGLALVSGDGLAVPRARIAVLGPDRPVARGVAARVGARARALAHRPADPRADVRVGRALAAALGLVAIDPALAVAAAATLWLVPWWRDRQEVSSRARSAEAAVPELVDLVRLGVSAGLPVRGALEASCRWSSEPIRSVVRSVLDDADRGLALADALAESELTRTARPLVDALVAGERYGAPLSAALVRVGDDARRAERHRAERAARRLPVALLFPLVCCTLPAFVLLTVVPVLVSTLASLEPS